MRAESRRVKVLHNYCPKLKSSVEVGTTAACNVEIVKWLQWNSTGAACNPMCGGCRCGKCAPGGARVRDHQGRSDLQAQVTSTATSPTGMPGTPGKRTPLNNRKAVKAAFLKLEKRLERDPKWKEAYAMQVHDMVSRGAAIKLSRDS